VDFLKGTTAAPAIRLNDPDYAAKLAKWRREAERDEMIRLMHELRMKGRIE
jgi:hypothetical protein